jgi:hypothetical protein
MWIDGNDESLFAVLRTRLNGQYKSLHGDNEGRNHEPTSYWMNSWSYIIIIIIIIIINFASFHFWRT